MPKKTTSKKTSPLEIAITPRLRGYLKDLVELEGYGNSPAEVGRNLIWNEINQLLIAGRLEQRDD